MSPQFTRKHVPSCIASLAHAISIYAYHAGTHVHKFIHTYACTLLRIYKHADAQTQGLVQTRLTHACAHARACGRADIFTHVSQGISCTHARRDGRTDVRTDALADVLACAIRMLARMPAHIDPDSYAHIRAYAHMQARALDHLDAYTYTLTCAQTHAPVNARTHARTHVKTHMPQTILDGMLFIWDYLANTYICRSQFMV